MNNKRAL